MHFLLTIFLYPLVIIYIPLGLVTNVLAAKHRLKKWPPETSLARSDSVESFHSAKSHLSSSSDESIYEPARSSFRRDSSSSRSSSRRSSYGSSSGISSRKSSGSNSSRDSRRKSSIDSISSILSQRRSSSGSNSSRHSRRKSSSNSISSIQSHGRSSSGSISSLISHRKSSSGSISSLPSRRKSSSGSISRSSIKKSSGSISFPIDRANSNSFDNIRNKGISKCNSWQYTLHHRLTSNGSDFYVKYSGFSINSYLSKSEFSNRIYKNVWSYSNYKSYWKNNYKEYKSRVVANINLLRLSHRSGIVKSDDRLEKLAQDHANKMAKSCTLFNERSDNYGIVVGMSYYPAASIIVTKWYDEHRKYNYLSNRPHFGTQMFTQLIWKSAVSIGVGVARSGDYLFVTCYFYPKGNIAGYYRKNVCRRKPRWRIGK